MSWGSRCLFGKRAVGAVDRVYAGVVIPTDAHTDTVPLGYGAKKTYTIKVYREQDPNYVPSSDNNLSGIQVEGFLLSPVFSAENTKYVIWLPYETESVILSGTAADSKASVRVVGGESLTAGADNEILIICTAENGTEKVYTVIAKRAAPHGGSTEPTEPPTEPTEPPTEPTEPPTEPTAPTTKPTEPTTAPTAPGEKPAEPAPAEGYPLWSLLLVGLAGLGVGAGAGIVIGKKVSDKK